MTKSAAPAKQPTAASPKSTRQKKTPATAADLKQLENPARRLKSDDTGDGTTLPTKPLPQLPDDVKKLIDDARTAAKQFSDQQKVLAKQLEDANETERDSIRNQMLDQWQRFRDEQLNRVQDIKDRINEMQKEFRDQRDKLLEGAKEDAQKGRGR